MNLKGKTAVITGGSRGLGLNIASLLSKRGVNVVVVARTERDLKKVANEIGGEYYVCDITNSKQCNNVVQKIIKKHRKIDILINNAGIWHEGSFEKHSEEILKNLFDVNIIGMMNFTKRVVSHMKKKKNGQILNVSSTAGIVPSKDWGPYTATKYAVRGFTDSLKLELDEFGIKVIGFYPGGMNTSLFKDSGFPKEYGKGWMMDIVLIGEKIK